MKLGKIFPFAVVVLGLVTFFLWMNGDECGNSCDKFSLTSPFGSGATQSGGQCITQCLKYYPNKFFYLAADILILAIVIYIIYLLVEPHRRKHG